MKMKTTLIVHLSSFMSKVDTNGDCWTWLDAKNSGGYGTFQDGSRHGVGAHRWMHEQMTGERAKIVRHSCGNPSCVKPTHLKSGSQSENMQDKFFDGTQNTQKLTPEDVREIRRRFVRYSQRKSNAPELAEIFGVGRKYIVLIAEGGRLSYVR